MPTQSTLDGPEPPPTIPSLSWQDTDGRHHLNFHPGQLKAWNSTSRIIMILSGAQGGKTALGPFWMAREIQRCGPGDYLIASPTFQLMSATLFPKFLKLFKSECRWGEFTGRGNNYRQRFVISPYGERCLFGKVQDTQTQIFFGHAGQPESLESMTAKAIWLDEAGQKSFRIDSWYAINRRTHIQRARILISTTPYGLGWLKDLVFEPWRKAKAEGSVHPDIDVIQFKSTENPAFPKEEYERAKLSMPAWKHRMFYDGIFEKPAGSIYDCFEKDLHVVAPFTIPKAWPRYLGLDFGGVHTAGVFLAGELDAAGKETGRLFIYREYPEGGRWGSATSKDHARRLLKDEDRPPLTVGGAASEGQWRSEFRVAGLPVREPPIKDVEVGIDRVYGAIKRNELFIFDTCLGIIDEVQSYSRELDDLGNPTEKIEDKAEYHRCDGLRYVMSYLKGARLQLWIR